MVWPKQEKQTADNRQAFGFNPFHRYWMGVSSITLGVKLLATQGGRCQHEYSLSTQTLPQFSMQEGLPNLT